MGEHIKSGSVALVLASVAGLLAYGFGASGVLALVFGIVVGVIGYLGVRNWELQRAGRDDAWLREERRHRIARWREMCHRHVGSAGGGNWVEVSPHPIMEEPEYPELRAYLAPEIRRKVEGGATPGIGVNVHLGGPYTGAAGTLLDEIDRLEKEWGLR